MKAGEHLMLMRINAFHCRAEARAAGDLTTDDEVPEDTPFKREARAQAD